MTPEESRKEKRLSDTGAADVLLIVPPVAQVRVPPLAPHLLQACCQREGFSAEVFYANLRFAQLIGFTLYNTIVEFNSFSFIGERLFTASAFDLPPMGRNIYRLIDPDWFPDHLWQRKNETAFKKMSEHLAPIRRMVLSVDWRQVEKQAAQWTADTAAAIAEKNYRVVGCSNTLGGIVPAAALLNSIKKKNPRIITVLGGSQCDGDMAEGILSLDTGIDYIFSGESDETFPAFLHRVRTGKPPKEKIIYGKDIIDLDRLPLPDYGEYLQQAEEVSLTPPPGRGFPIAYETSRGCRWKKCTFCGLTGDRKSQHIKSPEIVLPHLEELTRRHPDSDIHMTDNLMPVRYIKTLFPQIAAAFPGIRIHYEVNAGLTLRQLMVLKQAGIVRIQPGIEALSAPLLERIRKGVTVRGNIALLRCGRSIGMDISWNLLVGIPGEGLEEYEETLELLPLIRHLQPPDRLPPIKIGRFSLYQREPETFGITNLRPAALYGDVLPSHAQLDKIAYFFAADFPSQVYEHPDILTRLQREFRSWAAAWAPYTGNPLHPGLPKLHLEPAPGGGFILHDTRGLPGTTETTTISNDQARFLLTARPSNDSPEQNRAVEAKIAVIREQWFIPLAVATPGVLTEFGG